MESFDDRGVVANIGKGATLATLGTELVTLIYEMRWLFILSIVLVMCDLWFGISESRKNGVEIRFSRACRRTMNKIVDYCCYLLISGILGLALSSPFGVSALEVATIVILFCCVWELDSIYGHICVINDVPKELSIRVLFCKLLKVKYSKVGKAIEEAKDEAKGIQTKKTEGDEIEEFHSSTCDDNNLYEDESEAKNEEFS